VTEEEINAITTMFRAGGTPREIAAAMGLRYDTVLKAQARARDKGLLPPKRRPHPRQVAQTYVRNNRVVMGHVSDVLVALTREQRVWLVKQTEELGCVNIAEYLTELTRDEYERENGG
jgi:hypothetical protein